MLERSKIDPWNPGEIQEFPTMFRQTGHRRNGPVAIIQDIEVLLEVTFINYDHTVPEFKTYCEGRGIWCGDVFGEAPADTLPEYVHIHAAKIQDCWELWLREIGALPADEYSDHPFDEYDLNSRLLRTIYKMPRLKGGDPII